MTNEAPPPVRGNRRERRDGWTPDRRKLFIEELAASGSVASAARAAAKARSTAYELRQRDVRFAEAWDLALDIAADEFESQLRQRVLTGVEKTLHYRGEVFGTERVFSDHLAIQMLGRLRPMAINPTAARREKQRPARDICDKLTERAVSALKARADTK